MSGCKIAGIIAMGIFQTSPGIPCYDGKEAIILILIIIVMPFYPKTCKKGIFHPTK
jgi:hypothetical protein